MNDYKEVILFDDVDFVNFNYVPSYFKTVIFDNLGSRVIYANKTYRICFKYIYDSINGNHIIVTKCRSDTLEEAPFKKGELEKFFFTNVSPNFAK